MAYQPHPTLLPPSLLPPSILSLFNAPPPPPGDAAVPPPGSLRAAVHLLYAVADAALGAATDALAPIAPGAATLSSGLHPPFWDPFLAAVAVAHVGVVTAAVATRGRHRLGAQLGLLLYAGALVAAAPTLNRLGGAHWTRFARRNYFDEAGAFVCLAGCGVPLAVAVVAVGRLVMAAGEESVRAAARKRGRKRD